MTSAPEISVVLPTYNEAESLRRLVPQLLEAFRAGGIGGEIIVVDDTSPDGTGRVADEFAAAHPDVVRVVHRPAKAGLATAALAGWRVARASVLAVMDADGQHPAALPVELLRRVEQGADLAVASRYAAGGGTAGWNPLRLLASRLGTMFTRLVLPGAVADLRDPLSGCFAFRREIIAGKELRPLGYKILLEVLARGDVRSVVEVPYTFSGREAGRSKAGLGEFAAFLVHLFRLAGQPRHFARLMRLCAIGLLLAAGLASFAYYATQNPVDFRVYYYGARALLAGNHDLYAPDFSPMLWPMNYKYPPWFLLAFLPFALLPLPVAAALWVLLKFFALYAVVRMTARLLPAEIRAASPPRLYWLIPVCLVAPYLVLEFRYGNAHFFVFAATVAGLYFLPRRPAASAAFFALGIATKLVPVFFLPYLLVQRRWRMLADLLVFLLLLALLPAFYFGFDHNAQLVRTWVTEVAFPERVSWGSTPDHSLHGVLTRYLSEVSYAGMPDPDYPNIHLANLSPATLRTLWLALALPAYAGLLLLGWRLRGAAQESERSRTAALEYSLLFCASLLLAPYAHKIYLVALLFPAVVLMYELPDARSWRLPWLLALGALLLVMVPLLAPGRALHRLLEVYSPHFFATLAITVSIFLLLWRHWVALRGEERRA